MLWKVFETERYIYPHLLYASTFAHCSNWLVKLTTAQMETPSRNTKGGKYRCTVDLLFDWFGLVCFANKTKIVSCRTSDSKQVKQEVNGTVILPPFSIPCSILCRHSIGDEEQIFQNVETRPTVKTSWINDPFSCLTSSTAPPSRYFNIIITHADWTRIA